MSYDAGDPKNVKDAKRKAYHLNEKIQNGIAKICNDPECRLVLAAFLDEANIFQTNFNSNATDHAYNEGFRSAGLWWLGKALLHDGQIMGKIQTDKDLTDKAGNHDGHNTDDPDSSD